MGLRRLISVLSVVVATGSIVAAAPKKGAAPAKGAGSGSAAAPTPAPDAAAGSGSAVAPIEDTPPSDMNGTDENPDAPKGAAGMDDNTKVAVVAVKPMTKAQYPTEEALRPITLPQNMSEVSIAPHAQVGDGGAYPYAGGDALRARYGITNEIQLGFTYVFAGIYPNPSDTSSSGYSYGLHSGKALGLDVTVQIQKWLAVKVGVPVYLDPVAVSIAAGAPIKFHFGDKYAIGGLDDLINIKIKRFAPDFYQEYSNALAAYTLMSGTTQSPGTIRVSAFGIYQSSPNLALIGRAGVAVGLSTDSSGVAGNAMGTAGGTATFLRAGVQWTPRRFIDVGGSLGFDDLGHIGSFGPAGFLALRI